MKNRLFIIVVLMFFFCGISWSQTAPGARYPVNPATVPPSSISNGLVDSPSQIDTSGNLVITGNVAGGRHFRGVVPYQATSEFWAPLGSSSLDSFSRYSSGLANVGRYGGALEPYYSPSATVTTTRPGYSGVFGPLTTNVQGRAVDEMALPSMPYYYDAGVSYYSGLRQPYFTAGREMQTRRPLSMTPQELQELISTELGRYSRARWLAAQQEDQMEQLQLQQGMKQLGDETTSWGLPQLFELQTPVEQRDVYEQMKQEIVQFQELLEQLAAAEQIKEAADGREKPSEETTSGLPPISREIQKEASPLDASSSIRRPPDELSDVELAVTAKAIWGEHKTFASFSKDKFNQHLRAAEDCLKQGKYYRAADAYTLASIYKPDDPLAYAGKSHALFAAGEYMSSALFLSRALEIFPEYARFKIDIVAMVGDRDKLEDRIVDIQQCQQVSGSAELQFLLAYIYYQMDRLESAKEAIDQASEKMPDPLKPGPAKPGQIQSRPLAWQSRASLWPAVLAVKKAIEEHKNSE